jgi:hypothetical protein
MTEERDPFALAGQPEDDTELYALIEEWRRREAFAEERDISDDERADRCDAADEIRDRIHATRPVTLAGVLAVFDFSAEREAEDPDKWPAEAIEGLRDILTRDARQ